MPDMDAVLPHDTGSVHDFRAMIARHAHTAEQRYAQLSQVIAERAQPLTRAEAQEHLLAGYACQYAWATVSLIGFIAHFMGEHEAWEAAAMVEDMAVNGGAPYTEDVPFPPVPQVAS